MHASIRRYKTNSSAELTRRVKEGFVPLISKSPGFVAYYAIDTGQGEWASISIFTTQAEAEQSNWLAGDWAGKNAVDALSEKPAITAGTVVIHKAK